MKSTFLKTSLAACVVVLSLSGVAMALPVGGETVTITAGENRLPSSSGGEFSVAVQEGQTYTSFCLEKNEYISIDGKTTYTIATVADYATNGGVGASDEDGESRDYVSNATKWVFWNYLEGTFDNYITQNYSADNLASDVQNVIWFLEEEIGSLSGMASAIYNLVSNRTDLSIVGIVKVLNLVDASGKKAQSQLIAEAAPVPEPTTMLLFGTGLVGLAGITRRRVNR